MTARPDVAAERPPVRPPSIAIVGNDALLAARPASAVQLTHGLTRLGFDAVVPASWGDELVANACLERCARRDARPAVLCSCPMVAERLLATGTDLSPFLVPLVTPAVAVARYLRALAAPARPRITWIGGCPGAIADEIDERLTPAELFERLVDADHGGAAFDARPSGGALQLPVHAARQEHARSHAGAGGMHARGRRRAR
jgi:hypothetical protein